MFILRFFNLLFIGGLIYLIQSDQLQNYIIIIAIVILLYSDLLLLYFLKLSLINAENVNILYNCNRFIRGLDNNCPETEHIIIIPKSYFNEFINNLNKHTTDNVKKQLELFDQINNKKKK